MCQLFVTLISSQHRPRAFSLHSAHSTRNISHCCLCLPSILIRWRNLVLFKQRSIAAFTAVQSQLNTVHTSTTYAKRFILVISLSLRRLFLSNPFPTKLCTHRHDEGRNFSYYLRDHTVQHTRKLPTSKSTNLSFPRCSTCPINPIPLKQSVLTAYYVKRAPRITNAANPFFPGTRTRNPDYARFREINCHFRSLRCIINSYTSLKSD
jgi:hypothetical protein